MKPEVSNLEKFLDKSEWQYKSLLDVVDYVCAGALPRIADQISGNTPVIKQRDLSCLKSPFIYECKTFLDDKNIKNKRIAYPGDLLLIYSSSEKIMGRAFLYLGERECLIGGNIFIIRYHKNPRYLLHVLNSPEVQKQIRFASGRHHQCGTLRIINLSDLRNVIIPIPPKEVQEEIVKYLDNLVSSKVELEESLQKMLELRKKQYEHYKEKLLLGEVDRWGLTTLSLVATDIYIGNEVRKGQLGTGNFPSIRCGDINSGLPMNLEKCISFVNPDMIKTKKYFDNGDIIISGMGGDKDVGKVCAYLGNSKCIAGEHVIVLKHRENPKFLAYAISSKFCRNQIQKIKKGIIVKQLFPSTIKKIKIPLPPIKEQERIVSILDQWNFKFLELEKHIESLIEIREKQYNFVNENIF